MSSGFDWFERGSVGYVDWVTSGDQVQYVLSRPLVAPPGTVFNYNSGALHLLSVILTRACAPTATFAAQHLFGALGIASRPWPGPITRVSPTAPPASSCRPRRWRQLASSCSSMAGSLCRHGAR
jgi:CubicO group peptidase (beta-lactamase class C family)